MGLVLKTIVFLSGGVLMALEIVGSRILAPYFGNSIFVWGSLISTVLAALTIGYYWGGVLSQNEPRLSKLGWLILVPGVLVLLLPQFYPHLNQAIARADFGVRLNPLIASAIYFMIPGIFLGTIAPYAVRLDAKNLKTVGNTAGILYALSTCGSIVGTVGTAFYLIPNLGVQKILYVLGACLLVTSLLGIVFGGLSRPVTALFWFVLGSTLLSVGADAATLLEKESLYHRIRVVEEDGERLLFFDQTKQSGMDVKHPYDLRLAYTRYMTLAFALNPDAKRVLFIGLGGGSLPKKYARDFPGIDIEVAELDPEVVKIAKNLFFVKEGKNFRISATDGRLYLQKTSGAYDVIFLDAYYADAIPFHMTTQEFYGEASKKLSPGGVLATNVIGSVNGPDSRMFRSIAKTLKSVFPSVYVFKVGGARANPEMQDNIIAFASKAPVGLSSADLKRRVASASGKRLVELTPGEAMSAFWTQKVADGDVPLLTDDYAPVDSLLHFRAY